nr:uncharacterized protein LOC129386943 [Dermacentor andersoni]
MVYRIDGQRLVPSPPSPCFSHRCALSSFSLAPGTNGTSSTCSCPAPIFRAKTMLAFRASRPGEAGEAAQGPTAQVKPASHAEVARDMDRGMHSESRVHPRRAPGALIFQKKAPRSREVVAATNRRRKNGPASFRRIAPCRRPWAHGQGSPGQRASLAGSGTLRPSSSSAAWTRTSPLVTGCPAPLGRLWCARFT